MRSIFRLVTRNFPRVMKKLVLPTFITFNFIYYQAYPQVYCSSDHFNLSQTISFIEKNTVRIQFNGNIVGLAYCFSENLFVSISHELQQHHETLSHNKRYEFYIGDKKLSGNFKMLGNFQNLTFFEQNTNNEVKPLPSEQGSQPFLISPVQVFKKGEYPRIKNGYMVAQDSGFGVVDGNGELGDLVIRNGKVAGIVTQVGKELQTGLLRIIEWQCLPNILKQLRNKRKMYFGISAQAQPLKQGIQVVRISPNSPLNNEIVMGDTILTANNHKVRQVEALRRISILSDGQLTLEVLRQGIPIEIRVKIE